MSVNEKQVGGSHYRSRVQHWDFVTLNGLRYLEGCATKYPTRWRGKHNYPQLLRDVVACFGFQLPTPQEDLSKSLHYVEKLIDLCEKGLVVPRESPTVVSVEEFVEANKLSEDEAVIIDLLTNWQNVDHLKLALVKITKMVEEASKQ